MKKLHHGHCLLGLAAALVVLIGFGVPVSVLGVPAVAAMCPIMMFVMMRMMMREHGRGVGSPDDHRAHR